MLLRAVPALAKVFRDSPCELSACSDARFGVSFQERCSFFATEPYSELQLFLHANLMNVHGEC